jgi:acyl carrier protein
VESDKATSFSKGEFAMLTRETIITKRVYKTLQMHLGNDVVLSPESDLLNDLGMDSLEQVELGLKLEKYFGIKIPAAALRTCVTIEDVVQLVQRLALQKEAQEA